MRAGDPAPIPMCGEKATRRAGPHAKHCHPGRPLSSPHCMSKPTVAARSDTPARLKRAWPPSGPITRLGFEPNRPDRAPVRLCGGRQGQSIVNAADARADKRGSKAGARRTPRRGWRRAPAGRACAGEAPHASDDQGWARKSRRRRRRPWPSFHSTRGDAGRFPQRRSVRPKTVGFIPDGISCSMPM